MTDKLSPREMTERFCAALAAGTTATVTRGEIKDLARAAGLPEPSWYLNNPTFKVGRGTYARVSLNDILAIGTGYNTRKRHKGMRRTARAAKRTSQRPEAVQQTAPALHVVTTESTPLPSDPAPLSALVTEANVSRIAEEVSTALGMNVVLGNGADTVPYIPARNPQYVPWGHFATLKNLIASGHFLPAMIVGPSGNGKTDMCEQIAASLGREYVRANVTRDTDEDDLLGGFRLVDENTVFSLGPVPLAMLRGAVLNLDEIDLGGPSLMCLQPVLEGKPLFLKKIGKYIQPAPGFTVVATANTKGRGDDGRYMHTTIMNDAMLERFAGVFEQGWPDEATEKKILMNILTQYQRQDRTLVDHLVAWARVTRNNFEQHITNDQIATRRLLHIVRVYCALGDINAAVNVALARFESDTTDALRKMWDVVHGDPAVSPSGPQVVTRPSQGAPF